MRPPLFPAWSNGPYRLALALVAATPVMLIVAALLLVRTPYGTGQFDPVDQPIFFDHRHHARDDGIECLYCHAGAEVGARAGIPATEVCIGCHGQIWSDSPLLIPVRRSYLEGTVIPWRRVYDLPDFVYFHHGVHTQAGVACASCHGDVAGMARVHRVAPLTMDWCLDCHRDPPGPARYGRAVTALTTCSACHR